MIVFTFLLRLERLSHIVWAAVSSEYLYRVLPNVDHRYNQLHQLLPPYSSTMHVTYFSVLAALAGSSDAFFRMSCPGRVVRTRLDPIVTPGRVSGHVHTISGGAAFSPSMTYEGMRASKCSSCTIKVSFPTIIHGQPALISSRKTCRTTGHPSST